MPAPIAETRLQQIASDACDSALSKASTYTHSQCDEWNGQIINKILQALISESKTSAETSPQYKFAVNSTIIQHAAESTEATNGEKKGGRRGMHSATGAYWNNERDGMWNYKYNGAEARGMDVVISVMWVGV